MIEKIKAAAMAATQGEWNSYESAVYLPNTAGGFDICCSPNSENNAKYIATANPQAVLELIERLEAAEKDAAKWHEYQAKKKVLADRGFGKSPMRDMKESEK